MNAPLAKEQIALLMTDSLTYRAPSIEGTEGAFTAPAPATFGTRLRRAFATLLELPRRRAVVDELSTLSDRELADIGLNRADVTKVFNPRFARDRSY